MPTGWMDWTYSRLMRRLGLSLILLILVHLGLNPALGASSSPAAETAGLTAQDWTAIQQSLPPSAHAYLKASNTGSGDGFGQVVAISGDTVVGAMDEDSAATGVNGDQTSNSASNSGAAYVYTRSGTTWSQQAYLKASNTESGDSFGEVALSGDTIIVGADSEDSAASGVNGDQTSNSSPGAGAVYAFGSTAISSLSATSGTPQSSIVNTPFASQLQVTVVDGNNNPLAGVQVTFSAPTSGASGTFPGGNTAITNASGQASVPFTANGIPGSYRVTANLNPALIAPATFELTNVAYQLYVPQLMR